MQLIFVSRCEGVKWLHFIVLHFLLRLCSISESTMNVQQKLDSNNFFSNKFQLSLSCKHHTSLPHYDGHCVPLCLTVISSTVTCLQDSIIALKHLGWFQLSNNHHTLCILSYCGFSQSTYIPNIMECQMQWVMALDLSHCTRLIIWGHLKNEHVLDQ